MFDSECVTIIIPTINRYLWVERTLGFYNQLKLKHPIFIGDSSSLKNYKLLKTKIKKYKNLTLSLYYLPNLSAEQVIYKLSKSIKTRYATFLADDDIILPSFFDISVKFLSKEKNFIGVTGTSYCYSLEKNKIKGKISSFGNYPIIESQENNYFERISNNFNTSYACVFTIVKIEVFVCAFTKVNNLNKYHQTYILGELLCSIEYLKIGKIKKINKPFIIRQQHDKNNYGNRNLKKWINSDFQNTYHYLHKNLISAKLSIKKKNILSAKLDNFISDSISVMCEKDLNYNLNYKKKNNLYFLLKFFVIKLFFTCNSKYKELLLLFRYLSKC